MPHIFIHGLGQTASSWEQTIWHLNLTAGCHCPNLPDLFQDSTITYSSLYEAFKKYCGHFSEPLNLCGLSLGGILALHYTIEHPDRVKSLVLIGTQYCMPKALLHFQNIIFRFMPDSMFQQMGFGKKDFISLSKSMMELDFRQHLNKASCPVMVICGGKDGANKKASKQLSLLLPNAQLKIIPDTGHELNIGAPERLADIISEFYTSTRST